MILSDLVLTNDINKNKWYYFIISLNLSFKIN
jgi:hypothetical protein